MTTEERAQVCQQLHDLAYYLERMPETTPPDLVGDLVLVVLTTLADHVRKAWEA
jgi:hypothetical protein